jgi:ribosomal protein S24E
MENELIKKNQLKQEILQELENGPSKKTFPRMSTEKIMDIIGVDINQHYLRSIRT